MCSKFGVASGKPLDSPRESTHFSVGSFARTCGVQPSFELFHPEGEQQDSDDMAYWHSHLVFKSELLLNCKQWSEALPSWTITTSPVALVHNRQVMPFPEEDETFQDSEKAYRTTREHEVSACLTTWSAFGLEPWVLHHLVPVSCNGWINHRSTLRSTLSIFWFAVCPSNTFVQAKLKLATRTNVCMCWQ